LTPAQARQVHAALGEILDRITGAPADDGTAKRWGDGGSGSGWSES
jgi:hypothetical protein